MAEISGDGATGKECEDTMSPGTIRSDQDASKSPAANATEVPGTPAPPEAPPQKLTYQVILRHLAKFRDGAPSMRTVSPLTSG